MEFKMKAPKQSNFLLKVGTFNVHDWMDPSFQSNHERVLKLLKGIDLDVVCLQEVVHPDCFPEKDKDIIETTTLDKLSADLKMQFAFSVGNPFLQSGNAILSKYPIVEKEEFRLIIPQDSSRSMVSVQIQTPIGIIGVNCLHLDHVSEEKRLEQLQVAHLCMESSGQLDIPHLLCGDFNSLSDPKDYSEDIWNDIVSMRKSNKWELPRHDVIAMMQKLNYTDTWKEAGGRTSEASCWAMTRIDYIWSSSNFLPAIYCECHDNVISDHNLVEVHFQQPLL